LNTDSDEADVTSLGRPFHTFAPAAGKARPVVLSGITTLLSLGVYQVIINEKLPTTSDAVPLLGDDSASGASERFRKWAGYKLLRTLYNLVVKVACLKF